MIHSPFFWLALMAAGALSALAWFILLAMAADYRLGRHEVEVLLFDRVIRRIPFGEIDDVVVGIRMPAEFWPGPYWSKGRWLSIRKKHGLLRYLVICPRRPESFRRDIFFALNWNPDAE